MTRSGAVALSAVHAPISPSVLFINLLHTLRCFSTFDLLSLLPFLIIIFIPLLTLLSFPFAPRSQSKNLAELSSLGHFLKGSSAALGITKVQNTCEEIQYYGKMEDYKAGRTEVSEKVALKSIEVCVKRGKGEYGVARKWLEAWFLERGRTLGSE